MISKGYRGGKKDGGALIGERLLMNRQKKGAVRARGKGGWGRGKLLCAQQKRSRRLRGAGEGKRRGKGGVKKSLISYSIRRRARASAAGERLAAALKRESKKGGREKGLHPSGQPKTKEKGGMPISTKRKMAAGQPARAGRW